MADSTQDPDDPKVKMLLAIADKLDALDGEFRELAEALGVDLGEAKERTAVSKSDDRAGVDRELQGLLS